MDSTNGKTSPPRSGKGKSVKPSGETQSFASQAVLPSSFANVPKLILLKDQPSPNWVVYKDAMYDSALENFEDEAILFETSEWEEVQFPNRPTKAMLDGVDGSLIEKEYLTDYKEAKDLDTKAKKRRKSLFGILSKSIPDEIWNVLSATPNFKAEIELKQDTRALWKLLDRRCGAGATTNRELLEVNMHQNFFKLRQKEKQSIDEFYNDFTNCISMFSSAGVTAPSHAQQALVFLKGADQRRYGQAVTKLDNEVKFFKSTYPTTLSDSYAYLREYKTEENTPDPLHNAAMQSVYKTVAENRAKAKADKKTSNGGSNSGGGASKQESGKKGNHSVNGDSEAKPDEKPHDSRDSPRVPNTPCKMCESLGFPGEFHWHSKCPRMDEALAILTRHAADIKSPKPEQKVHAMSNEPTVDPEDEDPYGGINYYANLSASYVVKCAMPKLIKPPMPEEDFDVLLDNQSTVDLFHNHKLLDNIRELKDPQTIIGLGGHTITVRQCGDLRYFGTVLYSAEADVNVLSFGKSSLNPELKLGYNSFPDNMYWMLSQRRLFTFKLKGLNYVCNMRTNQPASPPIDVHSVYTVLAEPDNTDSELTTKPAITEPTDVPIIDTLEDETLNVPQEIIPSDTILPTVQDNQEPTEGDPPLNSVVEPPDMSARAASQRRQEPNVVPNECTIADPNDTPIAGVEPAQRHLPPAVQQQPLHEHDLPQPQAGGLLDPHPALPPTMDTCVLENHNAANIISDAVPVQEDEVSDSDDENETVTVPGEAETAAAISVPAEPPPRHNLTRTRVPLSTYIPQTPTEPRLEPNQRDICAPGTVVNMERYERIPRDTCDDHQAKDGTVTFARLKISDATKPLKNEKFRALRERLLEWKDKD